MRQLWDARVNAAREALIADGVRLNQVETEPFRERMRPVWDSFVVTAEQRSLMESILAMGGGNA
jgi:TRAP-type C4-dicarboxylate transport system substrate-binding protein